MRSGSSFILHVAIVLIAISYATADYSKSKSKSKFYEQTIKDLTRKSIVFDKHTPDVFYCIPSKPVGDEKVIVKARPIHKLCEYEGELPKIYRSDCYKDVDESDYACKEKYRIMMRQYPPGSDSPYNGTRLMKFMKSKDIQKPTEIQKPKDTQKAKETEKARDAQKPKTTQPTNTKTKKP